MRNFRDLFYEGEDEIGAGAVAAVVRAIQAHFKRKTTFKLTQLQIKMCEHYFPPEGKCNVQGCLQFLNTVFEISKTVRVQSLHFSRYTLDIL